MSKCGVRQSLAQAYSAAAAELNRMVGQMSACAAAGTGAAFQSARVEFSQAKRAAEAAKAALDEHEREHRCSTYS